MIHRIGQRTLAFENTPHIRGYAAITGPKEGAGPLGKSFDLVAADTHFGQHTWELAEAELQKQTIALAVKKSDLQLRDLDLLMAGDLLNQCIGSSIASLASGVPFAGLYGACSTMAEGLALGACMIEGGAANRLCAAASSHFCSAERQYRFPLSYGGQRTPTAQWTVTGSGAALVCSSGTGPRVESCTVGTVTDLGIKDANNMGAAMAPAALATIKTHFEDMHTSEADFDLIVTGDLGQVGKDALLALSRKEGLTLAGKLQDCGTLVFDLQEQDVHAGGSGCGCSAITLCSELLNKLNSGKLKKILFCGTGALLSPTSTQQGLPIPGVCHAVCICGGNS